MGRTRMATSRCCTRSAGPYLTNAPHTSVGGSWAGARGGAGAICVARNLCQTLEKTSFRARGEAGVCGSRQSGPTKLTRHCPATQLPEVQAQAAGSQEPSSGHLGCSGRCSGHQSFPCFLEVLKLRAKSGTSMCG